MTESSFNRRSTAEDVTRDLDLSGITVVITGINSGLGRESLRVLAGRGARVIGTARSLDKAESVASQISGAVTPLACELSEFDSVSHCADQILGMDIAIDVLICNAGIMALPQLELAHGFEKQFAVNHLGHFILVHKLMDRVREARQGRVVMLSSLAHKMAPLDGILFDNLDGRRWYKDWPFYGQSKLANMLTAVALAKRFDGTRATANSVHPGIIRTNLSRSLGGIQGLLFNNPLSGWAIGKVMGTKTTAQGAATQCYVATRPELASVNGGYFADCDLERPSRYGQDEELAERLWHYSVGAVKEYL